MRATPSLAITAARTCPGHQIARAQRVAASHWGNKDCNQKLQTAIFGSLCRRRETQLWFRKGKITALQSKQSYLSCAVRAKPELSKYFLGLIRGPWLWPVLHLQALKQTPEAMRLQSWFLQDESTSSIWELFLIYLFIYSYQPYLLSHRQKVSSFKSFIRMCVY